MPETVLLFDLFGVIAHHQSPEGRNRLLETAAGEGEWVRGYCSEMPSS
jgi:hypothetical protein